MPASSKRKDQAVPMRPVHRKEQAAEEHEQRAQISQHRVGNASCNRAGYSHQPGLVCPPLRSSSARALVRDLVDCLEMGRKTY